MAYLPREESEDQEDESDSYEEPGGLAAPARSPSWANTFLGEPAGVRGAAYRPGRCAKVALAPLRRAPSARWGRVKGPRRCQTGRKARPKTGCGAGAAGAGRGGAAPGPEVKFRSLRQGYGQRRTPGYNGHYDTGESSRGLCRQAPMRHPGRARQAPRYRCCACFSSFASPAASSPCCHCSTHSCVFRSCCS
jgi:hypothetical protein